MLWLVQDFHFWAGQNCLQISAFTVCCVEVATLKSLCRRLFQETRVTSVRDILEMGVKEGKLKPSQLKFLNRQQLN